MISKKIIATLVTAAVLTANCMPVFAITGETQTGDGVVEYDNSVAVAYDSVTLPTFTDVNYDFTLDPTKQLHKYDPDNFESDTDTVFFESEATPATLAGSGSTELYVLDRTEVASGATGWKDNVVKSVSGGLVETLEDGLFVWQPKTTDTSGYTAGNTGMWTGLTADNYGTWFKMNEAKDGIVLRGDYRNGAKAEVCDGKIYADGYKAATTFELTDTPAHRLSEYITVTSSGEITDVDGTKLFVNADGSGAQKEELVYTPAEVKYRGETNKLYAVNRSTNSKTITVTITLNNASGLTFVENEEGLATDASATSIYVAARGLDKDGSGTREYALVADESGTTASTVYTVDLAPADITETTYRSDVANSSGAGGKNYYRYDGPNPVYTSNSFYIAAKANGAEAAEEAWKAWAENITAGHRPTFSIVYKIDNKVDSYTITFDKNDEGATAPQDPTVQTNAEGKVTGAPDGFSKTGSSIEGWYEDAACTPEKKVDFSTKVFTEATTLYANWQSDVTDDYIMTASNGGYGYTFVTEPTGELTARLVDDTDRSVAINAGNATYANGTLTLNSTMTNNVGLAYGNHTVKPTIGGTQYTLTIANPVMTASAGGYSYTFGNAPTGELTALTVDGNDATRAIDAGNATYSNGVVSFNSTMTTNLGLATGNHRVDATIGVTVYKLYIAN
jgi:hypothetical protein